MSRVLASSTKTDGLTWVRLRKVILERGLVSIGGYKAASLEDLTRSLFLGDRDAILLGIRIATFGADFEGSLFCPECNEPKSLIFELDKDITTKSVENPYAPVEVTLRKNATAVLRRALADDQDFAFGDGTGTTAEMNTRLLSRLLLRINDIDMLNYPDGAMGFVRNLGIQDRILLCNAIGDMEFGPRLGEVVVACPDCGSSLTGSLGLPALF
jgi:hypothetical protein